MAELDSDDTFSVVAIGGYGRSELSLFSDVDVMVLHQKDDPSELAAAIFRPLWDANLRVGHSVRTVTESAAAARERFETHTTLLTGRLVAGSDGLFQRLTNEIASVTRARPLRRYLVSEERERRRAQPYLLMATNVKTGRGGLRTLQAFEWERRREELIGRFSPESTPEEASAHDALLAIRNALHAATGRAYDIFSPEIRETAGSWLGLDVHETAETLVSALQTVDGIASHRWPEVIDSPDSVTRLGRKVWQRFRGSGPEKTLGSEPSIDEFMTLLRSGEQGQLALARLEDSGALSSLLPEWGVIRVAPQLAPFHDHPVNAHLWRAVEEMLVLIDGDNAHYGQVAAEVSSDDTLLLAAFFHDIGKGHGGDHANVGADIARSFCSRLGFSGETTRLVERAVRQHLLLSDTATRRDIDDPAVIDEVVRTVGDLRALQVLYLLTVADARATGATMWSEWKATLVRTLFLRCAVRFGADRPVDEPTGTTLEALVAARGGRRRSDLENHIRGMPSEYLRSASTDEILWHLDLIDEVAGGANIGIRSGEAAETAVVVGRERSGFRRAVAESFAANGIDVLEARMLSRSDGTIIDTFQVRDDRTGKSVAAAKWDQTRADLVAALAGILDTESKVAARAAAYSARTPQEVAVRVETSTDPASKDTIITIHCADRIGRLAEILDALFRSGLEIRLAKLDSRGGEVVDTFHVRKDGAPIHDLHVLSSLENEVSQWIEP